MPTPTYEEALEEHGSEVYDDDQSVQEIEGFKRGHRVYAVEDSEEHGYFSGDEGYVIAIEKLGAEQYNNVRHALTIGWDQGFVSEADPFDLDWV